jgi:hypothetical protein
MMDEAAVMAGRVEVEVTLSSVALSKMFLAATSLFERVVTMLSWPRTCSVSPTSPHSRPT